MLELFWDSTINFLIYWGIWLLVPLLVDVITALVYFLNLFTNQEKNKVVVGPLYFYPPVTIVVPVYNSAGTLTKCLQSILDQNYPAHLLQVVCVNNGSQDDSFQVFQRFQAMHHELNTAWSSLDMSGKSAALNAGIYSGYGSYLINLDSDAWLERNAVQEVVRALEDDPSLVAVTGSIHVDKTLGEGLSLLDLLNYCEVIEYLIAFGIGRSYQSRKNTIFTLSGAFSAFRRETLLQSFLYQDRTVSEDTDLTYNIRHAMQASGGRIGCLPEAIAYVEPVSSLARLYSQRVRWQRGELEVVASHFPKLPGAWRALLNFTGRLLISDHTLAFSRLVWTFLIPVLYFLGYALPTIMLAMTGLFACYLLLDTTYFFLAYKISTKAYRKELLKIWWVVFLLPFYRYMTYWFRLAGIIVSVTEEQSWRAGNPVQQLAEVLRVYQKRLSLKFYRGDLNK